MDGRSSERDQAVGAFGAVLTPSFADVPATGVWRVIIGLGDAERERGLLGLLVESNGFTIVGRCLSADDLTPQLRSQRVDVVLVAADLHHFGERIAEEVLRQGSRLIVLTADRRATAGWQQPGITVLAADAGSDVLLAALRGHAAAGPEDEVRSVGVPPHEHAPAPPPTPALIVTVVSGPGSPGRTTLAANLAMSLGSVAPTVLVDGDGRGPGLAAFLDADPTLNLYMVAHASPRSPAEWDRVLQQELQPLGPGSPQGWVLCGVPKPAMRGRVSAAFMTQLLGELGQRYRYVVVDTGGNVDGEIGPGGSAALDMAGQVLVAVTPDLLGLAHGRLALAHLRNGATALSERVAVVVNRHHRKHHADRRGLERALDTGLAGIIPYDYHAAERAMSKQRPLVLDRHSRAGRAVLDVAERLHGGDIQLPAEVLRPRRRWQVPDWLRRGASAIRRTGGGLASPAVGLAGRARRRRRKTVDATGPATLEGGSDGQLAGTG